MPFDVETHLASCPEKYRDATRDLYHFVQARAGKLSPRPFGQHGIIGWGDNGQGWFVVGICARATGAMLYAPPRVLDPHDEILRSRRTGLNCVKLSRIGTLDERLLDEIVTGALNPPADADEYAGRAYAERAASKERLQDFDAYLEGKPEKVHQLARRLYTMIKEKAGEEAYAYDSHVLGFGKRRDGWFKICMAARASGVMLYTSEKLLDRHQDLIKKSWRTGRGCLKLTRWEQLPEEVIADLIERSLAR